ncbi:MAG: ribosome biogenesis GTPase YlqF [Firmicutes bacterium]|nr:ribosome biogenesis GTPase YlqF [Bacillota bacterium]
MIFIKNNIFNWYPGHMAKTKKNLKENLFLIDLVIEIIDARIPLSSKNPEIDNLLGGKKKIMLLNKCDLADDIMTKKFIDLYRKNNYSCFETDCLHKKNFEEIYFAINNFALEKNKKMGARGRIFSPLRIMVVGIPNVGKSSFINKFVNKKIAKTANKPGVTLNNQWIKINKNIELLDTPGILQPKFDDEENILNLIFVGAIKENNFDMYNLALKLIEKFNKIDEKILVERYGIEKNNCEQQIYEIATKRGYIKKNSQYDLERAAINILNEFRAGKLGKITLD